MDKRLWLKVAAGIGSLGFLIFGRNWVGSFLVTGSVVLLTLLLAPEAYIAIGLAFNLLILGTVGAMVVTRSRRLSGAAHRLVTPSG